MELKHKIRLKVQFWDEDTRQFDVRYLACAYVCASYKGKIINGYRYTGDGVKARFFRVDISDPKIAICGVEDNDDNEPNSLINCPCFSWVEEIPANGEN